MVLVCLLWSLSGIVTRSLQAAKTFEVTFWRSLFAALTVAVILVLQRGGLRGALAAVRGLRRVGFASSLCWAAMFTCFMLALTQTSTANTFVVNALYPVFAAGLAWVVLGARVPMRTWVAMFAAIAGLVYMVSASLGEGVLGIFIALGVPIGASINVVLIKRYGAHVDLIPAVLVGALLSALVVLPLSVPFKATGFDVSALALLGVVQLGLPCALMVVVARHLPPAEVALLSLLEAVLAPLWTWIGVNEVPSFATLVGGGIAFAAITVNETLAYLEARKSEAE